MSSIDRVLEKLNPPVRALLAHVHLDNIIYGIKVTYRFKDDSWVDGPTLDIDALGKRFPDCEVGY